MTKAFDATALALSLTLVAMFVSSLVEKLEQSLLERVDQFVDAELAHRFVRTEAAGTPLAGFTPALQLLMEKQIATMEKVAHGGPQGQQDKWAAALEKTLDAALTRFGRRSSWSPRRN